MSTQQQPEKKKRVSKKAADAEMLIDTHEPKKRASKKKVDTINDTTAQLEQILKAYRPSSGSKTKKGGNKKRRKTRNKKQRK